MSLLVCNLLIVVPCIYLFVWRWRSKRNEEQLPENQQQQQLETLTELDQTGYLYSFWGAPLTMSTIIQTRGDGVYICAASVSLGSANECHVLLGGRWHTAEVRSVKSCS